jgi:hypothetical protein
MTVDLFTQSDRADQYAMNLLERNLIWLLQVLNIPYVPGETQALLPSTVLAATRYYYQTYAADFRSEAAQEAFPRFLAMKYECQSPQVDTVIDQFMGEDGEGAQVFDLTQLNRPSSFERFNCCDSEAYPVFEQLTDYIYSLSRLAKEAQKVGHPIYLA